MAVGARGGLVVGMEDRVTESGSVSVGSVVSGVVVEGSVRCGVECSSVNESFVTGVEVLNS